MKTSYPLQTHTVLKLGSPFENPKDINPFETILRHVSIPSAPIQVVIVDKHIIEKN